MFLQYFKKKENIDQELALKIYSNMISAVNSIIKKNKKELKNEFNTSFELISIILFSIFFYSKKNDNQKKINQILMNLFISDIDKSLRFSGIGDMKIGKYVKLYVKKYYFRVKKLEKIFNVDKCDDFKSYITELSIFHTKDNEKTPFILFDNLTLLIDRLRKKQLNPDLFVDFFI